MIYQCQKCGLSKCDGAMGSVLPQCKCDWTAPASKPWVGLVHEETHEVIETAGADLLELAKLWSDNKVHVYQFDNEARRIIEAVLRRASAKLREKNA